MVRVRNSSTAALHRLQLHRLQLRRLRQEMATLAARARIVDRDRQDDAIQGLFGIGLAMQITKRELTPAKASRMADHIDQLQGVIRGFRAAIEDMPDGPADLTPRRIAMRVMVTEIDADRSRRTTLELSGPVKGRHTRSAAARAHRTGLFSGIAASAANAAEFSSLMTTTTSTASFREERMAEAFVTLADTLVARYDLVELLQYLVEISVELLDATAAGLVVADGAGRLNVLASTSDQVELLESLQISSGAGPCVECYTSGEPQSIADVTERVEDWPQFAPLALQQGFRSVHAVPLRLGERVIGALNLFRTQPGRLADRDRRFAQALADVATVGILQVSAAGQTAELNRKLEHALASRDVIEQAKGVLAQSAGFEMDEAFLALRDLARQHGMALTATAPAIVDGWRELVPDPRTSMPAQRPPAV